MTTLQEEREERWIDRFVNRGGPQPLRDHIRFAKWLAAKHERTFVVWWSKPHACFTTGNADEFNATREDETTLHFEAHFEPAHA